MGTDFSHEEPAYNTKEAIMLKLLPWEEELKENHLAIHRLERRSARAREILEEDQFTVSLLYLGSFEIIGNAKNGYEAALQQAISNFYAESMNESSSFYHFESLMMAYESVYAKETSPYLEIIEKELLASYKAVENKEKLLRNLPLENRQSLFRVLASRHAYEHMQKVKTSIDELIDAEKAER